MAAPVFHNLPAQQATLLCPPLGPVINPPGGQLIWGFTTGTRCVDAPPNEIANDIIPVQAYGRTLPNAPLTAAQQNAVIGTAFNIAGQHFPATLTVTINVANFPGAALASAVNKLQEMMVLTHGGPPATTSVLGTVNGDLRLGNGNTLVTLRWVVPGV